MYVVSGDNLVARVRSIYNCNTSAQITEPQFPQNQSLHSLLHQPSDMYVYTPEQESRT